MRRSDVRNIAIVAHVDHGKTTLVDSMLKQAKVFRDNQFVQERIMDSNDLERERGITILSKNTSITYKDTKINIIDTPGHSDFGGEVERILNMVEGVLLVVDSVEGPMPQTRFVLKKALEFGHAVVVVVNKIDRPSARPDYVINSTFELFIELNASDEQCDFQAIYASGIKGKAGLSPDNLAEDLGPLFESIIRCIPGPCIDRDGALQLLVTNIEYDEHKGRIAIGRLHAGFLRRGYTMESLRDCTTSSSTTSAPAFHTLRQARRAALNRVFAAVYSCAILALLYHHALKLIHSTSLASFFISLSLFISDIFLAFGWVTRQSFRMNQVYRSEFPEKLKEVVNESDFPALDVFICTADPYKEPPMSLVNTALSVMAYEYPAEKVSVYISDDGGSQMTLFALMEAAKFASHWLPFCRKNNLVDRSPDAYFASNHTPCSETENIKIMYESMKIKVDNVLERGKVDDYYIIGEEERTAFTKWTNGFTRQDHPPIIQVLSDNSKDKDISGHLMPSLIYVSREKSRTSAHHFKAGALNALVRVSAIMTNAPIILTLDCDMYSNDPQTPIRVLCYLSDPKIQSTLGYIQFPQKFHGLNKNDIYACEYRYLFIANSVGMDGLFGPNYVGSGCFFRRRALFGGPLTMISPEIPELNPHHVVDKRIQSQPILELAHKVAGCNYENNTSWGYKTGFKYGSLVEDYFTGYRLQGEGWKAIFCNPKRPAFLGDIPICLVDGLNQCKRWAIGLLEVVFSKYNPMIFGTTNIGLLVGLGYAHYSFWPSWSIPTTIYAFIPQLALLNGVSIFPKVSEPWFFLYGFLFLGAYGQHLLEFVLEGGTIQRWWNDQRMWMIRGLSCFLFGSLEYLLKHLGISTTGFNLTSKVVDDEQSKRYEQGVFDFGVPSPMFVPLVMAAIINLAALVRGLTEAFMGRKLEELFVQVFIAGFVVVNSAPIYEAMVLRSDKGRMPTKTTSFSIFLALALYVLFSLTLRN